MRLVLATLLLLALCVCRVHGSSVQCLAEPEDGAEAQCTAVLTDSNPLFFTIPRTYSWVELLWSPWDVSDVSVDCTAATKVYTHFGSSFEPRTLPMWNRVGCDATPAAQPSMDPIADPPPSWFAAVMHSVTSFFDPAPTVCHFKESRFGYFAPFLKPRIGLLSAAASSADDGTPTIATCAVRVLPPRTDYVRLGMCVAGAVLFALAGFFARNRLGQLMAGFSVGGFFSFVIIFVLFVFYVGGRRAFRTVATVSVVWVAAVRWWLATALMEYWWLFLVATVICGFLSAGYLATHPISPSLTIPLFIMLRTISLGAICLGVNNVLVAVAVVVAVSKWLFDDLKVLIAWSQQPIMESAAGTPHTPQHAHPQHHGGYYVTPGSHPGVYGIPASAHVGRYASPQSAHSDPYAARPRSAFADYGAHGDKPHHHHHHTPNPHHAAPASYGSQPGFPDALNNPQPLPPIAGGGYGGADMDSGRPHFGFERQWETARQRVSDQGLPADSDGHGDDSEDVPRSRSGTRRTRRKWKDSPAYRPVKSGGEDGSEADSYDGEDQQDQDDEQPGWVKRRRGRKSSLKKKTKRSARTRGTRRSTPTSSTARQRRRLSAQSVRDMTLRARRPYSKRRARSMAPEPEEEVDENIEEEDSGPGWRASSARGTGGGDRLLLSDGEHADDTDAVVSEALEPRKRAPRRGRRTLAPSAATTAPAATPKARRSSRLRARAGSIKKTRRR